MDNKYDYYLVRFFCLTDSNKTKHWYKSERHDNFKDALEKYNSTVFSDDILQVELLKEEHRSDGELIYERTIAIKDKDDEKIFENFSDFIE